MHMMKKKASSYPSTSKKVAIFYPLSTYSKGSEFRFLVPSFSIFELL